MKLFTAITLISISLFSFSTAHETPWTAARPDGHAPISVMGDHMHKRGEWMVSYRYMNMDMEGLLRGSTSVTAASQLAGTTSMIPTEMSMNMHMLGAMYAISDQWTLMGTFKYLDNEMSMLMSTGMMTMPAKVNSSGMGDLKFTALYDLARWNGGHRIHLHFGLGIPTGSINEKNDSEETLGYGMQLGSGTWDFHPAITYLGQSMDYSYGAQLGGILRVGENDQGYVLGNGFDATLWGARKITEALSSSVRFEFSSRGKIDGGHKELSMVHASPVKQPESQGRDLATLGLGLNYYFRDAGLQGHRLAVEWETPIDQKVNGVQLETGPIWTLGWQYAW